VTHPYLTEPVRAAAFAYLVANPHGSQSRWSEALDWTPSKFRRFSAALIKLGLAEITRTVYGSTFRSLIPPTENRHTSDTLPTEKRRTSDTPHLEALGSRSLVSRCEKVTANSGTAEAMMCIAIVNEVLGSNFKGSYDPISADNHGSQRAVEEWMAAGMSLGDMSRLLRQKAAAFNPSRSGGKLPGSLGYFTRWMLRTWAIERRQIPLPLMTKHSPRPKAEPAPLGSAIQDAMNSLNPKRLA
jgi:hypothetical protein